MRKFLVPIVFSLLFSANMLFSGAPAWAEDKTVLAVVDFSMMNVELESTVQISEAFRRALAKTPHLEVLSRDVIETAFEEVDPLLKLKLEQTDCTNVSCGVKVGRKLKADKTILGVINKKEDHFVIMAKLVNLDKRDVEFIASQDAASEKELPAVAAKLGAKVASWLPKPGESPEAVKKRRIAQQQKEEAEREKQLQAKRAALAKRKPGTCPEGMVLIPGGEFVSPTGKKITLKEYCIDKYEYPNKKGKRPLVKMEWFGAKQECEKQGKHLCSEAEWQFACSGPQKTKYPYGQQFDPSKCNTSESGKNKLMRSGTNESCVSAYGVYDMSGNVREWVADWYDPGIRTVVIKGGSYLTDAKYTRCDAAQGVMPFTHQKDNGFRCCK